MSTCLTPGPMWPHSPWPTPGRAGCQDAELEVRAPGCVRVHLGHLGTAWLTVRLEVCAFVPSLLRCPKIVFTVLSQRREGGCGTPAQAAGLKMTSVVILTRPDPLLPPCHPSLVGAESSAVFSVVPLLSRSAVEG